jgi:hypothetical protein
MPRLATDFSQSPLFLPVIGVSEVCQQFAPVLE